MKRSLFIATISILLLHVSAYSGESENVEDSETEASGDLAPAFVDSSCTLIRENSQKSRFSGECSLENAFTSYVGEMDPKTKGFLKTSSFKCSSLLKKGKLKTFECKTREFPILPRGQGTIVIKNAILTLVTNGVSYRDMKIEMVGDKDAKVLKDADSDDIKLDLFMDDLTVDNFLNQHFGVNYVQLKKVPELDSHFPNILKEVKLTALFNQTLDYVEVIFWNDDKSFFIFQKFASSDIPSVGFFKAIDTNSFDVLNKVLNVEAVQNFLPTFKISASCFSSSTSDITMIMSSQHRNLTKNCITEGSNMMISEGTTLRWRVRDVQKIKIIENLKSNGIVDVLQNEIGLSASLSEEKGAIPNKVIKVTSSDNITSSLLNIIRTFISNYRDEFADDPFKDVLRKRVVFNTFKIVNKKVYLECRLDEDWSLADTLVNLNGMNLKVAGEINNDKWAVSGNGEIMILGEMLEATVEKDDHKLEYLLYADFNASSMKALTDAANNVKFLPDEDDSKFESLKDMPLSSLQLGIKLNSNFLKFYGQSLSYASYSKKKDDSPSYSQFEIVLYMKDNKPKMIVAVCHDYVLFEKFTDEVLSIKLEGVPWLVFENLCYIMARDKESNQNIVNSFEDKALVTIKKSKVITSGIHFTGSISYDDSINAGLIANSEATKGEPVNKNIKKQDILSFIENNKEIFNVLKYGEGTISQSTFNFEAKRSLDSSFILKGHRFLRIKNPSLYIKEIVKKTITTKSSKNVEDNIIIKPHHKKHSRHHKKPEVRSVEGTTKVETERMVGMFLKGSFEKKNNYLDFSCGGDISSSDSGLLTLHCENAIVKVIHSEAEFKVSNGKSVANNNVFSIFDFQSKTILKFKERETMLEHGCLSFNIKRASQTYFTSRINVENFNAVLSKFQLNGKLTGAEHSFLFADSKFNGESLLVLSGKNTTVVDAGNRTARDSVLTLFGSVKRNVKDAFDYKIAMKKCLIQYQEWLPTLNVAREKFKIYHHKDRSMGPELKLSWNFCKNPRIIISSLKGVVETIGLSEVFTFEVSNDGLFSLTPTSKFFGEAKADISIKQEISLIALKDINPRLRVDLIKDPEAKSHITSTVESHFKSLAKEFSNAYSGTFFSNQNIAAEDLLYNSTKNVIDALEPVNKMISRQISNINSIISVASQDCVQECIQSEVKIPGISAQAISTNQITFEWKPDFKNAANVTCIAACEIAKSDSMENYPDEVNGVKKILGVFDKLNEEAKDIHNLYTEFESQSKINAAEFNEQKKKYKDLFALLNGINEMSSRNEKFFNLKKFEINANAADMKMQGDNCVENFQVIYVMFRLADRNLKLCQCFNGEYATYFANKVAKDYLGIQFPNLEDFYQFQSKHVAKQEEHLSLLEDSLKKLREKYKEVPGQDNVQFNNQAKDVLPPLNNSIIDLQYLTFHTQKLQLPQLTASSRALLDENHYTVTRSLKTRSAFLYSSPWAALSAFDLENSLKEAKLVVRALPSHKSHCSAVSDAGNQYVELYNSIRSISDSYSQTMNQLNLIHQSMEKETNSLKANKVGASNETSTDAQYWVRQLERGTQYFSDLMKTKLSKYSSTALNEFKSKFEGALKRNGVQNISKFVRQLKGKLQKALSTKKTKGISAASKLSDAIIALFSNPNLKLDDVTNRIKDMEKYVTNINGMVRTCKI